MSDGGEGEKSTGGYPVELRRRLALLRREHPNAEIDVDLIRADGDAAVVKASIAVPGAGSVSALGVIAGEPLDRAIERAEQRALERVLEIVLSGIAVDDPPAAVAPTPITNRQQPAPPVERRPPASIRTNAPIDIGAGRPNPPAPAPVRPVAAPADGEPSLADYSWTAFWSWARENGLSKQSDIEAIIGQSYENLTPAEVRKLILDKREK
jgi:hypothetical protein